MSKADPNSDPDKFKCTFTRIPSLGGEALVVTLPIPHKYLHPNARPHWAPKARETARHRATAKHIAMSAQGTRRPLMMGMATIEAVWYFPDKRKRDRDGLVSWIKAYQDGLTDAGVWEDDSQVIPLPPRIAVDKERPRVELHIREIDRMP